MYKKIMMAILILLINACSTHKIALSDHKSPSKVAVLSELENQINFVFVGATVFDDDEMQQTVEAWNINQKIENDISQKLWEKGIEVTILPIGRDEMMQERQKIKLGLKEYKNADYIIIVKPVYQIDKYSFYPEGYGVLEKNVFGIKYRYLYANIGYEVYSTKDGYRKAYYMVNPEGSAIKLDTKTPFEQLKNKNIAILKPQINALFDQVNTIALKELGFLKGTS